ncbi:MAG: radical SAM protein, partial [Deltaproteobacteria bacterium]|nr:radical SAM protein [Deltaproteobacteria bacterium]
PTIFFEYAYDTARLAAEAGLANVFVTNGYMSAEALETIHPFLNACNVDLKSFTDAFYKTNCRAHLEPVLETIRLIKKSGIWLEITTLLIPGQNDSDEEIRNIARFIAELDKDIPWHISRFHPDYRFTGAPTPMDTLKRALAIGESEGLSFIYIGNTPGEVTYTKCPNCKNKLIQRKGFQVIEQRLESGRCPDCGRPLPGVFGSSGNE